MPYSRVQIALFCVACANLAIAQAEDPAANTKLSFIEVAKENSGFVSKDTGKKFVPWGVNYDHDEEGRLIEDYWEKEWPKVEADFAEMKELGANVVRLHIQFGKFMDAVDKPNEKSLTQLKKLLALAEKTGLYLDLTGLGCYHKQDVPVWYDELDEAGRWKAQATFWKAVAKNCADSPAIFCYDLMNEPVVPGGKRKEKDWLGPPFGGKHFVQVITLDQAGRKRPDVAVAWTKQLVSAIREVDQRHLVTIGLVDWSLDRPGLTSGFVPDEIAPEVDFLCIHLYPKKGQLKEDIETLKGFAKTGKPVVIEETFALNAPLDEFEKFLFASRDHAHGWVGFYWGKTPAELRQGTTIGDAILLSWLEWFEKNGKKMQEK
ncbi:MAG: cellulase family glycosylhydrolase [Pirellulaceae bacterium]